MDLKLTPLKDAHEKLGAKMAPFGGWYMPIQYPTGIIAEHLWTRKEAGLFDICHMGEFFIAGTAKETGLDRILTMKLDDMKCGMCRYGFILNEEGGIIDDAVIYKVREDAWMLVVNAATIDKDAAHLDRYIKTEGSVENASEHMGKLDLQGPLSADVLSDIVGDKIGELSYYTFSQFNLLGEKIIISRTGYTGELGYELYIKGSLVRPLWDMLLKDKRVKPIGLGARDTLRLEVCLPLYGQDADDKTSPLEARLSRFVDTTKDFIGKDAFMKTKARGAARELVAFKTESRQSPRHGDSIEHKGKAVGVVTSGSFSPSLGCGIGLGYVESAVTGIGTALEVADQKKRLNVTIVDKPFYKNGTARTRENDLFANLRRM